MSEERLIELKDYFLAYPDTAYLPNMFSEVVRALEEIQQENQLLKIQVSSREEVANKYKEVIEEVRELVEKKINSCTIGATTTTNDDICRITVIGLKRLLQILDKAKEEK